MRLKVEIYHESAVHLQRALASLQSFWKDSKLILQFDLMGMKIYPRLQDISVVHFGYLYQISVSRELSAYNSIPTVLDDNATISASKPFFKEYLFKVSSQEQVLKFEIRNTAQLLEALRVVTSDSHTIKMIRLKKTDNRAQYHARLVFLELQENGSENLDTNHKPLAKQIEGVLVTSSILKVNIENPKTKHDAFSALFESEYPVPASLTSENDHCLYIMSTLLSPLIKDYLGSLMSKDQMYCTISGFLTNSKYRVHFEDIEEDSKVAKKEEERVTIAIEGKGTANVFERLSRRLAFITANGKFNENFELCMGQRDFEALNNVVTKLTIGFKPVSAVIKHNPEKSCYKVHLVLESCEHLQIIQMGKALSKEEFEK